MVLASRWPALTFCLLSGSWLVAEMVTRVLPPPVFDTESRLRELTEMDPKPGFSLGVKGLPQRGPLALVWLGDCTQCARSVLSNADWERARDSGFSVVFATSERDGNPEAPEGFRTIRISDKLKAELNAFFSPRTYLFKNSRLSAIERLGGSPTFFMEESR